MRHMKTIMLTALVAVFGGASTASATTLEVNGFTKNEPVFITASLKAGTSTIMRDTFFLSVKTCTASHLALTTVGPYTGTRVTADIDVFSFTNCANSITVHNPGQFIFEHIPGTTNARVYWENADVTTFSSIHNTYLTCTTPAAGTLIGTLTGVASGNATLDINATINCGEHLSSKKWTGTYTITTPAGLGVSA